MGHNRGWEEAASQLCGVAVELKTANAALLEAPGGSWKEVSNHYTRSSCGSNLDSCIFKGNNTRFREPERNCHSESLILMCYQFRTRRYFDI